MYNKIRKIREEKNISAADIAKACNTTTTQLYRLEKGDRELSFDWANKIARVLGVKPYELLDDENWNPSETRQMDIYSGETKTDEIYSLTTDIDTAHYATIPLYDMAASAGPGMPLTTEAPDILKYLIFELPYLRKIGKFETTFGVYVRGDSMAPVIPDGALALVDTSQKKLFQGKKYYIRMGDMRLVKYLEPRPGKLLLRSANKAYEDIVIDLTVDQPEDFEIIGMIIWHACED